jgi:putative transcriptional regulator
MRKSPKRNYLLKKRKEMMLTQSQVAEKLGISQVYYSELERGVKNPSLEVAIIVADFFEINVRLLKH